MPRLGSRTTRRYFFQQGAAAALAAGLAPRSLLAASANEQIRLGVVGCGWRGGQLAEAFARVPGAAIAGLCDPDAQRLDELGKKHPQAQQWRDLRDMFDSPEIDAVAIATCNHWHALAAIWALQAGKHAYVEKPLTNTLWEGERLVEAIRASGKICQIGTQQRSDPLQAEIQHFLHDEAALGPMHWVRVNRFGVREAIGKRDAPLAIPASVDYALWLGPAEDRPLYRNALHYDWHWDWNTGSGEMGNWGIHIIDDVRHNVFRDRVKLPTRVAALGARCLWNDAGDTPNVLAAALQLGEIPVLVALTNLPASRDSNQSPACPGPSSGYIVHCAGGRLEGQRMAAAAYDADGKLIKQFPAPGGDQRHQQNFIDAVRAGDAALLNAPAVEGHYSTAWCNLPNIAVRTAWASEPGAWEPSGALDDAFSPGVPLEEVAWEFQQLAQKLTGETSAALDQVAVLDFDPQTAQFVGRGAEQANALLRPATPRSGFELQLRGAPAS